MVVLCGQSIDLSLAKLLFSNTQTYKLNLYLLILLII